MIFWKNRLNSELWANLYFSTDPLDPDFIVEVDASEYAVGAVLKSPEFQMKSNQKLPLALIGQASTSRDLLSILYGRTYNFRRCPSSHEQSCS